MTAYKFIRERYRETLRNYGSSSRGYMRNGPCKKCRRLNIREEMVKRRSRQTVERPRLARRKIRISRVRARDEMKTNNTLAHGIYRACEIHSGEDTGEALKRNRRTAFPSRLELQKRSGGSYFILKFPHFVCRDVCTFSTRESHLSSPMRKFGNIIRC